MNLEMWVLNSPVLSRPHLEILKNCFFTVKMGGFLLFYILLNDKNFLHDIILSVFQILYKIIYLLDINQ